MARTSEDYKKEIALAFGVAGATTAFLFPSVAINASGLIVIGAGFLADYLSHRSIFDKVFQGLKLRTSGYVYPILKRKEKKDGYKLYEFTLPAGLSSEDFVNKQQAIEEYLGRRIEIEYGFKNLLIKVYPLNECTYYDYELFLTSGDMELLIGYDHFGKVVTADLSEGEPHMYVSGDTGSGKSTWLHCALCNLILNSKEHDIDLFLCDLKNGVELGIYKNCSMVKGFAKNESETLAILDKIDREVERRYELFAECGVDNIKSYNKKYPKLNYQLLVIDEFATLMYEKESTIILESLVSKARAAGVHVLLSAQRVDAKVLSGRIKANISTVLGLRTKDATNSRIIIGHDGLENLRGKGHGIFSKGLKEVEVQAPFLPIDRAKELIAQFNVVKIKDIKKLEAVSFDCLDKLV